MKGKLLIYPILILFILAIPSYSANDIILGQEYFNTPGTYNSTLFNITGSYSIVNGYVSITGANGWLRINQTPINRNTNTNVLVQMNFTTNNFNDGGGFCRLQIDKVGIANQNLWRTYDGEVTDTGTGADSYVYFTKNAWFPLTFRYENVANTFRVSNGTANGTATPLTTSANLWLDLDCITSSAYTMNISSIIICNDTDNNFNCNTTEAPTPPLITIKFINQTPENNATLSNINVNFPSNWNFTYNANCSLYINETLNQTLYNIASGNHKNVLFNLTTFPIADNLYNYRVLCKDNNSEVNSTLTNFRLDFHNISSLVYYDFFNVSTTNYTRLLKYNLTANICLNGSNLIRYINGVGTNIYTCNGSSHILKSNYTHTTEGEFNISFALNYSDTYERVINRSFISDLYNPNVTNLFISLIEGFNNTLSNITIGCSDSIYPNITYNVTRNGTILLNITNGNNKNHSKYINYLQGENYFIGKCSDPFGSAESILKENIYFKTLYLINEKTGGLFDPTNLSNAIIYYDDNSTSISLKNANTSYINFTSYYNNKLRVELTYSTGEIITRYIDVSLGESSEARICANTDPTTHYPPLVVSSVERPVSIKNVFANCLIVEDYTRFAYQDALIVKAFTIPSLYYLYVYDEGHKIYLASLDGSIDTYYNIDTLEYKQQDTEIDILGDALSIEKYANTTMLIRYSNIFNRSIRTDLIISLVNDSTILMNISNITNPNDITLYWDFSTLGYSNETMFRLEAYIFDSANELTIIKRYFNTNLSVGTMDNGFIFILAVLFTIFGLTFASLSITFGWFGALTQLGSIAILTLGTWTGATTLLMAFNIIILIYIGILMFMTNDRTGAFV
jgi:hypothetical protein